MNGNSKFRAPLTVYYDKSCSMCVTEMSVIEGRDSRGSLQLVDCSAPDFEDGEAEREGITREAMMAALHVRDADGKWFKGLDAFEAIYASVGLEKAAQIWGDRRLRPVLNRVYPLVARHRQSLSRLGMDRVVDALLRVADRSSPRH